MANSLQTLLQFEQGLFDNHTTCIAAKPAIARNDAWWQGTIRANRVFAVGIGNCPIRRWLSDCCSERGIAYSLPICNM